MTTQLSESMQRYLDGVADDVRALLGAGIELVDVQMERRARPRSVEIRAAYRMGTLDGTSVGRGASAIEAHARLREAIVTDRIGFALEALTRAG